MIDYTETGLVFCANNPSIAIPPHPMSTTYTTESVFTIIGAYMYIHHGTYMYIHT